MKLKKKIQLKKIQNKTNINKKNKDQIRHNNKLKRNVKDENENKIQLEE